MIFVSAFESPAVVAGIDNVTVAGRPMEQRGGHLGIAEHAQAFAEGESGGDDDGGAFVEAADEMEQKWPPDWAKGRYPSLSRTMKSIRVRWSASRACRPLRVSVSRRLTRSITL